jgi:chromosome segregation ATPase
MDMQRQVLNYANTVLPQEIQQAVKAEQARGERRVRKVQEECGIIKRELEKEQVARKAVKKAMEERLSDAERKMADIQRWVHVPLQAL